MRMNLARAIVVALTALSVGLFPVAGAHALASMSQTSDHAATSECCPHANDCAHQSENECGDAECLLKCSSVSAAPLEKSGATFGQLNLDRVPGLTENAKAQATNPPAPPPRA
jgi:hypothetical protein